MASRGTLKETLSRSVRRSAVARLLFDYYPVKIRLLDGKERIVPRRLWRMTRDWQSNADLRAESRQAYDKYRGGDFVDIGAFHGWYSLLLAPKANEGNIFVSLEPDHRAFPELLFNLSIVAELFPAVEVQPLPSAVGNGAPIIVSYPKGPDEHPRFASGASTGNGSNTLTVDSLVNAFGLKPAFVKIDVEGAEYFVLQGMGETLQKHHPIIMLEIHPQWQPENVTVDDVEGLLKQYGYTAQVADASDIAIRQFWA